MRATRIKLLGGCYCSTDLLEIDEIYITGGTREGFVKKEELYDLISENPGLIQVDVFPFPCLKPALGSAQEKYVRSAPDDRNKDALLRLPRY